MNEAPAAEKLINELLKSNSPKKWFRAYFNHGLINYIFFWKVALCGASGVVFAFILLTSFTSFREGELPLTFILVAVIFLGQQIFEGIMVQDNVSNLSHIIGGIVGAVCGYGLNKKTKWSK